MTVRHIESLTVDGPSLVRKGRLHSFGRLWDLLPAAGGYAILILIYIPIIWLALMSISKEPLTGIPSRFTGEWYALLFGDPRWVKPLVVSIGLAITVGLACMVVATAVGRVVPRMPRRGGLVFISLISLFVPGVVMGTALFLYFRLFMGFGLGLWSLFVGHFVWAFPFALLAVLVLSSRFDERLLDAAADLGATSWQAFWHIEFPALRAGIIGSFIFGFLLSFNELPRTIFLRGRHTTLPLYVWTEATSHTTNVPLVYSLSTLIFIISLVLISVAFWALFGRSKT